MQSEFDDHIKKQVDGFKLSPSAQVWDLVEAQLPEKKRRRFIYWWLPLSILLIGFGIYTLVGNKKENQKFSNNKTIIETDKNIVNDSINNLVEINKSNKIPSNKLSAKNLKNNTVRYLNKNSNSKIIADKLNGKEEFVLHNNGSGLSKEKELKNEDLASGNNQDKKIIVEQEINEVIKDNEFIKQNLDSQDVKKTIDSTIANLAKNEIKNTEKDTALTKNKKIITKNNLSKVKWNLIADIGSSNTVGKALGINNNAAYDLSNNVTASPGTGLVSASLSEPTAGISFGIGLQRTRQITNKLAWFGGVGYHYLSNHQLSGAFVDSSKIIGADSLTFLILNNKVDKVSNYYKYGNTLNHNNYGHLLNIDFGLKYKVGKTFSISGGLTVGYQFSAHWLQPEVSQKILYYSNKLTNKWNIGTNVGFDWQFYKCFSVGVFYNYNFNNTSLAAVQQSLHWQTVGVTFSVQLPFKK